MAIDHLLMAHVSIAPLVLSLLDSDESNTALDNFTEALLFTVATKQMQW